MSARLLRADDPDHAFAPPRVDYPINRHVSAAKSDESDFAIVFPIVDPFDDLVGEYRRRCEERDAMLGEILRRLVLVPLELQFGHRAPLIHNCVQNI
jgi:hypothetical protein